MQEGPREVGGMGWGSCGGWGSGGEETTPHRDDNTLLCQTSSLLCCTGSLLSRLGAPLIHPAGFLSLVRVVGASRPRSHLCARRHRTCAAVRRFVPIECENRLRRSLRFQLSPRRNAPANPSDIWPLRLCVTAECEGGCVSVCGCVSGMGWLGIGARGEGG